MLKTKTTTLAREGEVTIREMSARCYSEVIDARNEGKNEIEVAGIVCSYCVVEWQDKSPDEILEEFRPGTVTGAMQEIVSLSTLDPKSEADQHDSSSSD